MFYLASLMCFNISKLHTIWEVAKKWSIVPGIRPEGVMRFPDEGPTVQDALDGGSPSNNSINHQKWLTSLKIIDICRILPVWTRRVENLKRPKQGSYWWPSRVRDHIDWGVRYYLISHWSRIFRWFYGFAVCTMITNGYQIVTACICSHFLHSFPTRSLCSEHLWTSWALSQAQRHRRVRRWRRFQQLRCRTCVRPMSLWSQYPRVKKEKQKMCMELQDLGSGNYWDSESSYRLVDNEHVTAR